MTLGRWSEAMCCPPRRRGVGPERPREIQPSFPSACYPTLTLEVVPYRGVLDFSTRSPRLPLRCTGRCSVPTHDALTKKRQRRPMSRSSLTALVVSILTSLLLTSCSGANPNHRTSISSTTSRSSTTKDHPTTTTTTVPIEPGWTPVTAGPNGVIVDQRNVTTADGRQITVVRFRAGQVRFNLHIGSQEPPVGAAVLGREC